MKLDRESMEGIDFLGSHLRDLELNNPPADKGICASHNREVEHLYRVNRESICRGCALLRQAYPAIKGKSRLGLGSYLLLTSTSADYWGNHMLPASIRRHSATGALRGIIRDLIRTPPEPPWLFVAFSRSNSPDRLHVTTSNDLMFFSGKFFFPGTMNEPPVERLNRKYVLRLHEAAKISRDDWEKCARAHAALSYSTDALAYLREMYAKHPKLVKLTMPVMRTPEYNAVRLLAENV